MSNFFILSIILLFTFLAIGFANGSLDYLDKQLNDAFVDWITVGVPASMSRSIDGLQQELNADSNLARYDYDPSTAYVRSAVMAWDNGISKFEAVQARSIDTQDNRLLHDFILNKDNLIEGGVKNGFNDDDIGLIVTSRFLDEFSYPADANFIYCSVYVTDSATKQLKRTRVPIQVRAIVKVLPEKRKIIYPMFYYRTFMLNHDQAFDTTAKTNDIVLFYSSADTHKANEVEDKIRNFIRGPAVNHAFGSGSVDNNVDTMGHLAGFRYEISFDSRSDESSINSLYHQIRVALKNDMDTNRLFRWHDFKPTDPANNIGYDGISFYFHRLDSVRSFNRFLLSKSPPGSTEVIEVDENTLKDKENFNFLSYATRIISFLLIVFSALSVCLFIYNLLKSHLTKVKINIGTYKAIGLTDKESQVIYFRIVLVFILTAIFFSFIAALILGEIANFVLLRMNNINNISYFRIVDLRPGGSAYNLLTLFTVVWIIASALILSRITIRRILNRTPGDLIYNR